MLPESYPEQCGSRRMEADGGLLQFNRFTNADRGLQSLSLARTDAGGNRYR